MTHTRFYRTLRGILKGGKHLVLSPFVQYASPGHFYSPLPDSRDVQGRRERLFDARVREVPGVDLRTEAQLQLLQCFAAFMGEMPFQDQPVNGLRYGFGNSYFGYGDALVLYGMLRTYRPKRIIEVGSGYSSALMLDTAERFLSPHPTMTFIEPYQQERLRARLRANDSRHVIVGLPVQDVPMETFDVLEANDILFIDSSHVTKIGSDVNHLFFHVLPRLKPGVLVHFHDIFWPFEYPETWVEEGRAWNEAYLLRAFLQFNRDFEIRCFNAYLGLHHAEAWKAAMPLASRDPGGSLWLQRTRHD
jgi:predicted O-methyltransferase YrrM